MVLATSGGTHHTASVTLVVSADFTLAVAPSSLSLTRGSTGSYTATIGSVGGFTGNVSLSVTGLPRGASATFSPALRVS
jgi:hypothetical protein